ncbi:hypothetical protein FHS43_003151 [Streptosporangium becharense]|uniref:Uncharacterized protein n=1 Tax=Streptosporangium becharense TaxID=1816182 RepID=A0A7W9ICY4_9ACTN|nr:hypothetical protein [Streptosporangium becharense]MBB2911871.1 hypothetical protein [Streptosporangium becharense]MBB5818418.1 hypothetical protein [Streptosporangium becharense]
MTPQSDEDEVWRQIVASFNDTAERASGDQPWPDSENLPAEPPRRVIKQSDEEELLREDDLPTPGHESEGEQADADDEGHYVPPPPPPLPKTDTTTKIAWLALFGGPAYLLLSAALNWHLEGWMLFTAVAAFIGGFVALVVRMGDGPPGGSGWDDGAVV